MKHRVRNKFMDVRVSSSEDGAGAVVLLGCIWAVLVLNATLGGLAFQYCLWSAFARDIPWYADAAIGFFLGEFLVPAMIVCWVVRLCGVAVPFIS